MNFDAHIHDDEYDEQREYDGERRVARCSSCGSTDVRWRM